MATLRSIVAAALILSGVAGCPRGHGPVSPSPSIATEGPSAGPSAVGSPAGTASPRPSASVPPGAQGFDACPSATGSGAANQVVSHLITLENLSRRSEAEEAGMIAQMASDALASPGTTAAMPVCSGSDCMRYPGPITHYPRAIKLSKTVADTLGDLRTAMVERDLTDGFSRFTQKLELTFHRSQPAQPVRFEETLTYMGDTGPKQTFRRTKRWDAGAEPTVVLDFQQQNQICCYDAPHTRITATRTVTNGAMRIAGDYHYQDFDNRADMRAFDLKVTIGGAAGRYDWDVTDSASGVRVVGVPTGDKGWPIRAQVTTAGKPSCAVPDVGLTTAFDRLDSP